MLKNHLIDISIAAESLTALRTAAAAMATELGTIAVTLDDAQVKYSAHMGLRNETFSREMLQVAEERPGLVPDTINVAAIKRDITARDQLGPIVIQLRAMTKLAEDTHSALGIDAYNGCRALYMSLKVIAKVAGISEIITDIGRRFARPSRRTQEPTPEPTQTTV
jgi:hypothetical protein